MLRSDVQLFGGQLNALAETFDKKPVSVKAMEVWFDTLKEFPTERVMDVVNHWAKGHGKFPTPAEVWRDVNERMIETREEKAREEKALFAREEREGAVTPQGREIAASLKSFFEKQPQRDPKAWAREIIRAWREDDFRRYTDPLTAERVPYNHNKMSDTQITYALAALKLTREQALGMEREPGQDDEEIDYSREPMLNV